nr:alanine racemase [Bacillota bacterium]
MTWVTEIASASAALIPHPSRVEIDLDALTRNVRVLREAVGVAVTAVVKA